MKKPLYLAMGVGLAAGMVAFKPVVSEGASVRADDASTLKCTNYQYWQYFGGTVTCYSPGGNSCVVCMQ